MYHRERRKMKVFIIVALAAISHSHSINETDSPYNKNGIDDNFDNNIIDFEDDYSVKFNKNYGAVPWNTNDNFNKETHRYTVFKDDILNNDNDTKTINKLNNSSMKLENATPEIVEETTASASDYSSIPLELLSTTVDPLVSIVESTIEPDLSVIPLTTAKPNFPEVIIKQTVTLPPSTQIPDTTPDVYSTSTDNEFQSTTVSEKTELTTTKPEVILKIAQNVTEIPIESTLQDKTAKPRHIKLEDKTSSVINNTTVDEKSEGDMTTENRTVANIETSAVNNSYTTELNNVTTMFTIDNITDSNMKSSTEKRENQSIEKTEINTKSKENNVKNITSDNLKDNSTTSAKPIRESKNTTQPDKDESLEAEIPIFTGLDTDEETEVPEDYYDSKDVLPTSVPKTDALSVIFGLAGSVVESVVESVAERVVPKGIFDLFKRMQKQSEALEAERLRSREENGGLGQFGRGLLKSISSGLSKPLSQLLPVRDARDVGALDTDRGFVTNISSSVASAATTLADAFKDRVQAIYPGTVWCGDGHAASARSGELGLFFFTDTCCRQHDACRLYIRAGETRHGLTNTGLFTRSHCSCDTSFRECLHRTNSLVSAQIGLTYFNVLGPQCFRKAHPIVRCVRRTRITGQKCEEYELDFTKPKMWQWFDNETF